MSLASFQVASDKKRKNTVTPFQVAPFKTHILKHYVVVGGQYSGIQCISADIRVYA